MRALETLLEISKSWDVFENYCKITCEEKEYPLIDQYMDYRSCIMDLLAEIDEFTKANPVKQRGVYKKLADIEGNFSIMGDSDLPFVEEVVPIEAFGVAEITQQLVLDRINEYKGFQHVESTGRVGVKISDLGLMWNTKENLDLLELLIALYKGKSIVGKDQPVDQYDFVQRMLDFFEIEIKDVKGSLKHLANRKKTKLKYISELRESLIDYISDLPSFKDIPRDEIR